VIEYGPGARSPAGTLARLFPGARLEPVSHSGLALVLGQDHETGPAAVRPADAAGQARSANDDPCSNLSYG
jgi:hypothetical protein